MALKIRLRQQGRSNRAFYRMVVTDVRSPRDGKYVEAVGWYDPIAKDADKSMSIKADRIQHWLDEGAELTEKTEALLRRVAPEIVRKKTEKVLQHRAKEATKRKARKKAAAA